MLDIVRRENTPKVAPDAQCLGQLTSPKKYSLWMILFGDVLAVCGDALALVAFAVDAMAEGMGRESRHDAATDSFMV